MTINACGHDGPAALGLLCRHLLDGSTVEVVRRWNDRSAFDSACWACDEAHITGDSSTLVAVCHECADTPNSKAYGGCDAWRGSPVIEQRPTRVELLGHVEVDGASADSPRTCSPVRDGWLLLEPSGNLHRLGIDGSVGTKRVDIPIPYEEPPQTSYTSLSKDGPVVHALDPPVADHTISSRRLRLHASQSASYCAIVWDYGNSGGLIDVTTGTQVLSLARGVGHNGQTAYPCAFAVNGNGSEVLVVATDWNRLDAYDAATGSHLTARLRDKRTGDGGTPEHYLDYFHGRLEASPNAATLVSDGWIWHPVGVMRSFSLSEWLAGNVFEADDGPTAREFTFRAYFWDKPFCWVDDDHVAVWGLGNDDDAIFAGVTIYNAGTGVAVASYPGPEGELWSDGRHLIAAGDDGVHIWDAFDGAHLGAISGIQAISYNRWTSQLLIRGDEGLSLATLSIGEPTS